MSKGDAVFPYKALGKIFLDSAATSQKPQVVIDEVVKLLSQPMANPKRGSYPWAWEAEERLEMVRKKVANFIGSASAEEIVFTSGATEGLNMVAFAWGLYNLKDGDEVLYSISQHQSLILPWFALRNLLERFGVSIRLVEYDLHPNSGHPVTADIMEKITDRSRVLLLPQVHHIYGDQCELFRFVDRLPERVRVVVDAAQSIGHIEVDVSKLPAHFLAFSGHKCFALPGSGVLWVKSSIHQELGFFKVGGGMALDVNQDRQDFVGVDMPQRLEAGTPNLFAIESLGVAIDFLRDKGIKNIEKQVTQLTTYLIRGLQEISAIEFLPGLALCPEKDSKGSGIVAFRISGIPSIEVGEFLADNGIYLRCGTHCSAAAGAVDDSVRVSLHFYNTFSEIDRLLTVLRQMEQLR